MKRSFLKVLIVIAAFCAIIGAFSACGVEFKINFVVDGEVYSTVNTGGMEVIRMPDNPTKDDYEFDGWYWDNGTWQKPFTANSLLDAPLSSDMSVYAKWRLYTISVTGISLNKTEMTLGEGDIDYLTASVLPENATDSTVIWRSSNSSVAVVENGKVTALRVGNAVITAQTNDGGLIATCRVIVAPFAVTSVSLNQTSLSMLNGETVTLVATVSPANATDKTVLWSSSNSSIIRVDNGVVSAVGYGNATITVTTLDGGFTATCDIEVITDKITFNTLSVNEETAYGKVPNTTTTFSFLKEITEVGNASYNVYKEYTCETLIPSKSITLNVGDNTVYVLQSVGKTLTLYTVTIRRRPIYDVTFNTNGGTAVQTQYVEEDFFATEPSAPTKAGYTFDGWDYDFTLPIIGNTTINAQWVYYTVTTNRNNNSAGKVTNYSNTKVTVGDSVTLTATTNNGYTWVGWYNGDSQLTDDLSYSFTMQAENVTYTAKWDIITYTVSYNLNGGTNHADNPATYNVESDTITLSAPSKTEYTFSGWYLESEFVNKKESIVKGSTGNLTLYAKWQVYTRDGDYIYFGSYPQSDVTDSMGSAFSSYVVNKPSNGNDNGWTSYKYYIEGSNGTDYMWYKDITHTDGNKYRAVYFTSYRPYKTTNSSSADKSYQDDNGYYTSCVYWFKYEPIKWRILTSDGTTATILCEMIIDSQDYNYTYNSRTIDGKTVYGNNYEYSSIRAWLNDTFYNTAFSDLQKAIINTVTVDNSARSTNPDNNATQWNSGNNSYACNNTQDKVWLLSMQEVTKAAYGFATSPSTYDTVRRKKTTGYAKCQGAYTYSGGDYDGNGVWWLRSPSYRYDYSSWLVDYDGGSYSGSGVGYTGYGVVPALQITL